MRLTKFAALATCVLDCSQAIEEKVFDDDGVMLLLDENSFDEAFAKFDYLML